MAVLEWRSCATDLGVVHEVASLGVVTQAWADRWQAEWKDGFESGAATSLQDAKEQALNVAKQFLTRVLAQLDRTHDPVTGQVVQIAEVKHD